MITEEWIKRCVQQQQYRYSRRGDKERQNDGLSLAEVEEALVSGRIIEQYPDPGRGESCLWVGFSNHGKPVHIAAAG